MIGGQIKISLEREPDAEDWARDRRALEVLERCPDGVTVAVDIGSRHLVSQDAAAWLNRHDHRLSIVIVGSYPEAVISFIRAARAGEWQVVA